MNEEIEKRKKHVMEYGVIFLTLIIAPIKRRVKITLLVNKAKHATVKRLKFNIRYKCHKFNILYFKIQVSQVQHKMLQDTSVKCST